MTIGSGNFAELLWPGIADKFGIDYEKWPELYSEIFEIKRATKRFEKFQGVTGLGLAGVKSEGQGIGYADPVQGFQKEFVMTTFALGTSITKEMVVDEQYNYINEVPGMLSRSIRDTEETTAWNVINRATNTSYTGADGVVLASTAHVSPVGFTYSNRLTTDADLSQTSIETMIQQIQQAVDDQNLYIRLQPRALMVHPSNNFRAVKILQSQYVTGSADNDVNPIPGLIQKLVVSPYLTDTDAWGLTTNCPLGLLFLRREDTEIARDNEFDTKNLKIAVTGRWDTGWVDPRGFYYTVGA